MAGVKDEFPGLYLGSLPYPAQRAEIEALFAKNDIPIKKLDMSIDPFNGRNPGYCFVDLHTEDDAIKALRVLPGQLVRNRPIKVGLRDPKRRPSDNNRQPIQSYDRGWRASLEPPRPLEGIPNPYVFDRWARSEEAPSRWVAAENEGRRVCVGGLPRIPNQDTLNVEMRTLFEGWDIEAVSKIISPNKDMISVSGSHHFCFVDFRTRQEALRAVEELDGKETPWGGHFKLKIATKKEGTKVKREQLSGAQGSSNADRGRQQESLASPKVVRNLDATSWRRGG